MNATNLITTALKGIYDFGVKLYEIVNYSVSIKWLKDILDFLGSDIDLPENISILGFLTTMSVIPIAIIIIYSIFKP